MAEAREPGTIMLHFERSLSSADLECISYCSERLLCAFAWTDCTLQGQVRQGVPKYHTFSTKRCEFDMGHIFWGEGVQTEMIKKKV